jgi:hypothetical protein
VDDLGAVVGVAAVAAVASYEHIYALVRTLVRQAERPAVAADGGRGDLCKFEGDARRAAKWWCLRWRGGCLAWHQHPAKRTAALLTEAHDHVVVSDNSDCGRYHDRHRQEFRCDDL